MTDNTTGLLAGDDPDEALRRLVRHARQSLDAAGTGVNLPHQRQDTWRIAVIEGINTR
jgi:hypothetical protein